MDYGDGYIDLSDEEDFVCVGGDCISSDDDAEDFNLYNALQKVAGSKKPGWKNIVLDGGDDEDEFEKEMSAEISATITSMASKLKPMTSATSGGSEGANATGTTKSDAEKPDKEFYDEVYFDSDESDNEGEIQAMDTNKKKRSTSEKRRFMSNDELLYDPNMDDRDQAWVDEKRRSYQPRKKSGCGNASSSGKIKGVPLPLSDAVLNCPACLTTLTRDCQRHEIYQNQYRAMFVSNCVIDFTQKLSFPKKEDKKKFFKNKKKNKNKNNNQNNVGQMFINNIPLISVDQSNEVKIDENKRVENTNIKSEVSDQNSTNMNGVSMPTQIENDKESIVKMEAESTESSNIVKIDENKSVENSNIKSEFTDQNSTNMDGINMPTQIENGTENIVSMEAVSTESTNIHNQEGKQSSNDNSMTKQSTQSKITDASEWHRDNDPVASNTKKSKLVHNAPACREKASKDSAFGSLREVYMQPPSSKISSSGRRDNHPRETDEFFHPVSCSICNTKIAVYDYDEIYHFFNTVTSY